mmetsp:Transcript_20105/g.45560  ORF Transcript_20105/g.45560 Transcript_20105/m.45560 type:complete len:306 (-) Transcript_20105:34-951(-)
MPFIDMCYKYCVEHDISATHGEKIAKKSLSEDDMVKNEGISRRKMIPRAYTSAIDYRLRLHSNTFQTNYVIFGSKSNDELSEKEAREKCFDTYHGLLSQILGQVISSDPVNVSNDEGSNTGRENSFPVVLPVAFNRSICIQHAHHPKTQETACQHIALFSFNDLCRKDIGAADYRAIASSFSAIIIHTIPVLSLKEHNEARRFITLIDELYEAKCCIFCSAEAAPNDLFAVPEHFVKNNLNAEQSGIDFKSDKLLGVDVAQQGGIGVGQLASVKELTFAFQRAASRLVQMCSRKWWDSYYKGTDK